MKGLLRAPKKAFTPEQDNVILDLFNRKKSEKLTNIYIETEYSKILNCPKVAFKTLSNRYDGKYLFEFV